MRRGIVLPHTRLRIIKPEIRVLGVDDGFFVPHAKGYAAVVGIVFRGGCWLDGVMSTRVEVDGFDANEKIAAMIEDSPHQKQLRVILLNGVTFAGFNIVNIEQLNVETGLPVIAVTRKRPDFRAIRKALGKLPRTEERWKSVLAAGEIFETSTRGTRGRVFMEMAGIPEEDARKILKLTSTRSDIPEALRVAHIVASGIGRVYSDYLFQREKL